MKSTYQQVLMLFKEYEHRGNSLLFILHKKDCERFIDRNKHIHGTIMAELQKLSEKYCVIDPKTKNIMTNGDLNNPQPLFKEGLTIEMYTQEYNKLVATECNINL